MDWTRVADWSATALTLIGLGARQQYLKGKNAEKFATLGVQVKDLKDDLDKQSQRLSDGGNAFARIDENLKSLKEGVKRIEDALSTTNERIIQHITDGSKERT